MSQVFILSKSFFNFGHFYKCPKTKYATIVTFKMLGESIMLSFIKKSWKSCEHKNETVFHFLKKMSKKHTTSYYKKVAKSRTRFSHILVWPYMVTYYAFNSNICDWLAQYYKILQKSRKKSHGMHLARYQSRCLALSRFLMVSCSHEPGFYTL
jgi:hypothetical protein